MVRDIGFLIFPAFQLLDLTGPMSVFEVPSIHGPAPYRMWLLSELGGLVESSAGVQMLARRMAETPPLDTLVVVGGPGTWEAMGSPALLDFLRASRSSCRRVASICTGAFLLAAAGLLDGRAFLAETGQTPAKAVEQLRAEAARVRIETSAEPIEQIARAVGFSDPERMRRAFLRVFGQPPQALRRAARTGP